MGARHTLFHCCTGAIWVFGCTDFAIPHTLHTIHHSSHRVTKAPLPTHSQVPYMHIVMRTATGLRTCTQLPYSDNHPLPNLHTHTHTHTHTHIHTHTHTTPHHHKLHDSQYATNKLEQTYTSFRLERPGNKCTGQEKHPHHAGIPPLGKFQYIHPRKHGGVDQCAVCRPNMTEQYSFRWDCGTDVHERALGGTDVLGPSDNIKTHHHECQIVARRNFELCTLPRCCYKQMWEKDLHAAHCLAPQQLRLLPCSIWVFLPLLTMGGDACQPMTLMGALISV